MSDMEKRKARFMREAIGRRTREQLAEELYEIYLLARAECPDITESAREDTWPMDLHLADVLDKYVFRRLRQEGELTT
jgi:hypothetical protein